MAKCYRLRAAKAAATPQRGPTGREMLDRYFHVDELPARREPHRAVTVAAAGAPQWDFSAGDMAACGFEPQPWRVKANTAGEARAALKRVMREAGVTVDMAGGGRLPPGVRAVRVSKN